MACVMHGPRQTRREVHRAGIGHVDIAGTGVALESIPFAHRIEPSRLETPSCRRLGNNVRLGAVCYSVCREFLRLVVIRTVPCNYTCLPTYHIGVVAPQHHR
jgi:hypothetical protein